MNERITENLVRDKLRELEFYTDEKISVEEQNSQNHRIQKCLKSASKSGDGAGHPEFIIKSENENDFVIVIECKADPKKHISKTLTNYKDYAVDGVLLYASHLSKEFNVLAIGVSGQNEDELKISTYLHVKGKTEPKEILNNFDKKVENLIPFDKYINFANIDRDIEKIRYEELISFSRELHDYIRDYAYLSEAEKPLIVVASQMLWDKKV